jgi:RimJ/RimL family protein N-acetyltransferase
MVQPGEKLPDSVLNLRLPLRMDPVTLVGKAIKLVPFDVSRDTAQVFQMINGDSIKLGDRAFPSFDPNELIWKNFSFGPFPTVESFKKFVEEIISIQNNLVFCVVDIKTSTSVGLVAYVQNNPSNLKVNIRYGITSPAIWGTIRTVEMMYLLLKHAFDLGYRRVEITAFSFNYRSTLHLLSLGYSFDGEMKFSVIGKGVSYDLRYMSILDFEWKNRIKESLDKRIRNAIQSNPKL